MSLPGRHSILIVDDDRAVAEFCKVILNEAGHHVLVVHSVEEAQAILRQRLVKVLVTDVRLSHGDGFELLRTVREEQSAAGVVLMTAFGTIESAVTAVRQGAFDYLEKPFSPERLVSCIDRLHKSAGLSAPAPVLSMTAPVKTGRSSPTRLIGQSREIQRVLSAIARYADRRHPVLITGETGTGKEIVAQSIHEASSLSRGPFLPVDCGALAPELVESELFGHVRGAFTGSFGDRPGLLESAAGGTLFLDEIGELPLSLQTRLLRLLQDRQYRPLGSDKLRRFSGRVIAATHRDIGRMCADGAFRPDLLYRLNVLQISIAPLRDRPEDIPLLITHFLEKHGEGRTITLEPGALDELCAGDWPGNVRELENCIIRLIASTDDGTIRSECVLECRGAVGMNLTPPSSRLQDSIRTTIIETLTRFDWNVARTASELALSRATLYRKMSELGINSARSKRRARA